MEAFGALLLRRVSSALALWLGNADLAAGASNLVCPTGLTAWPDSDVVWGSFSAWT